MSYERKCRKCGNLCPIGFGDCMDCEYYSEFECQYKEVN